MLSSNMLLLNLIPLIDVTFSTPTGDYTHWRPAKSPRPVPQHQGVTGTSCQWLLCIWCSTRAIPAIFLPLQKWLLRPGSRRSRSERVCWFPFFQCYWSIQERQVTWVQWKASRCRRA